MPVWLLEDGAGVTGRGTCSGRETLVRPTKETEGPACLSLAMDNPSSGSMRPVCSHRPIQVTSPLLLAFPLINNQIFIIHQLLPDSESWGMSHLYAGLGTMI